MDWMPVAVDPTAPRACRHLVRRRLGAGARQVDVGILDLLVSEAVTDAISHGAAPIRLRAGWLGHKFRVEVADASECTPSSVAGLAEPHGLGTGVIAACASRWGISPLAHGRCLWFEVAVG